MLWKTKKVKHFNFEHEVVLPYLRVENKLNEIKQWSQESGIPYEMEYQTVNSAGEMKHLDEDDQHQLQALLQRIPELFSTPNQQLRMKRAAIWGYPSNVVFRFQDKDEAMRFKLTFG